MPQLECTKSVSVVHTHTRIDTHSSSSVLQCQQKIIGDPDQLMEVTLECIYSCERDDQLSLCYDILECLPQRGYGLDLTHMYIHLFKHNPTSK